MQLRWKAKNVPFGGVRTVNEIPLWKS
ncbi:hypothetical protein NC653_037045 [Populus alba x Populus x berolinensis]|uniref:Uncharacterized protein n=1 Tax=Populus alba x Populus x berolinensis TaxID=444605 RepID=A0AAD6LLP7_9ROSI|nr:hypothetical protein NC653_037045 [Populus alba x Populus x berolinensis]